MARPKNTVPSVELRLAITPQLKEALERLAETGLYGLNPNDAAIRLIEQSLHDAVTNAGETRSNLRKLK